MALTPIAEPVAVPRILPLEPVPMSLAITQRTAPRPGRFVVPTFLQKLRL